MKGILDRFEGEKAVILIEALKEEFIVPRDELPKGSAVNTYFTLEKRDNTFQIVSIDNEGTTQEVKKSSDLMAQLRAKSKGSKFKKKK